MQKKASHLLLKNSIGKIRRFDLVRLREVTPCPFSASLSDQLQPLSIATSDEHLSVARSLPALAPIPPSPTVTDAIDSALSQDTVGETVNLPILYESQSMRLLQYVLDRENLDCER